MGHNIFPIENGTKGQLYYSIDVKICLLNINISSDMKQTKIKVMNIELDQWFQTTYDAASYTQPSKNNLQIFPLEINTDLNTNKMYNAYNNRKIKRTRMRQKVPHTQISINTI